jgi:hypothetical protein
VIVGWGWGGPGWFWIVGLVLFALMICSVVWLALAVGRPRTWTRPYWGPGWYGPAPDHRPQALEELDLAYARGQLSREEYFRRRADLSGSPAPGGTPGFSAGTSEGSSGSS